MRAPDLSTTWLGLSLRSPLVVGAAAPLSEDPDQLLQLEQAGAAAIVLHSLFQEQIEQEQLALHRHAVQGSESYGEALSWFPEPALFHAGHDLYLRHIEQARSRLSIPLIASLNGFRPGDWLKVARRIEQAGAQAIELNIYSLPLDPDLSSEAIEAGIAEIVREVRAEVRLPLTLKLAPFFTNLSAMARRLADAGADGLTLFNRFYQPDIDIEELELRPSLLLSTPHDLRLPLRWIALLHGRQPLDLAASGGVHRGTDVVRLLMAGACVTQVVGALLRHGPQRLRTLEQELSLWLAEHDHASLSGLIGCMDQQRCPDPAGYERVQYMRVIQGYHPSEAHAASGPW
ncbi:MAG: dihydroorotate dehydrogenase-like protein [Synechococcaceae cyanobacterium]|nr:dihydroorotate dehydrogenase-like protein [Synechococcaceae cyanobacterium]